MDIRCGSCNKLFRVADEKVTGKGIRFKCSRCGEVITVTRDEAAASPAPVAPPKAPAAASTVVLPPTDLSDAQPQQPASPSPEFQPQEYQPPAPSAGLDDFDFSEPHAAAAAGTGQEGSAGGEGFSFDSPEAGAQESGGGGEISLSEEEAKESEAAFQFPADVISEPARKPAFAGGADLSVAEEGPSAEQQPAPELHFGEQEAADVQSMKTKRPAGGAKPSPRASVQEPPHSGEEGDIDLGQALAAPQAVIPEKKGPKSAPAKASSASLPEMPDIDDTPASTSSESIHPLASGNATGALAGLGCALPIVLLALFSFSLMARFVPFFASIPRYHLLAVMGTGLIGLSAMTGIVIAVVQAQAGKKLFFLLNVLIGAGFGMVYGAGMNTLTALASGGGLKLGGMISGAVSGGILAFLLSLLISLARRIMLFTRDESFAAPLTGAQKAGMALSLAVILASLYAEGTLIGSLEKAGREIQQQVAEDVTAEGVSAENVQGYVDPATGDLVVTGTVRNSLEKPKKAWYLEVDVFDKDQKVLATLKMLNGAQLFDKRDFDILGKRGKNIDELKAGMLLAFQGGTIPPNGNVNFEMHLMEPPRGIASIYPFLKKFSFRETGRAQ